jgi:hypothetical protein
MIPDDPDAGHRPQQALGDDFVGAPPPLASAIRIQVVALIV